MIMTKQKKGSYWNYNYRLLGYKTAQKAIAEFGKGYTKADWEKVRARETEKFFQALPKTKQTPQNLFSFSDGFEDFGGVGSKLVKFARYRSQGYLLGLQIVEQNPNWSGRPTDGEWAMVEKGNAAIVNKTKSKYATPGIVFSRTGRKKEISGTQTDFLAGVSDAFRTKRTVSEYVRRMNLLLESSLGADIFRLSVWNSQK